MFKRADTLHSYDNNALLNQHLRTLIHYHYHYTGTQLKRGSGFKRRTYENRQNKAFILKIYIKIIYLGYKLLLKSFGRRYGAENCNLVTLQLFTKSSRSPAFHQGSAAFLEAASCLRRSSSEWMICVWRGRNCGSVEMYIMIMHNAD